ncbi:MULTISPECIES: hypothetical protein [unclassified Lysinibacillus]|uniref:hypothetical protein n=1 Tax=unclassified Lysinibacillus TaxID=2636778 RepID=UPI0038196B81
MTKTKNERIAVLENEVAELKLIVHELRERPQLTTVINSTPEGPSTTNSVEDIIEFEGQQYRNVDREAQIGDVVVFTQEHAEKTNENAITAGKPYGVIEAWGEPRFLTNKNGRYRVYEEGFGRTPENVTVYELIESKPLTPNQQRTAVIEKAKTFVKNIVGEHETFHTTIGLHQNQCVRPKFYVNEKKRAVTVLIYGAFSKRLIFKGLAKCNPSDVFNEHIGKAIALGRALGLDVSEFEQVVQPTVAVGQILNKYWNYEVLTLEDKDGNLKIVDSGNFANGGDLPNTDWYTIINDTNAIYGGVE